MDFAVVFSFGAVDFWFGLLIVTGFYRIACAYIAPINFINLLE